MTIQSVMPDPEKAKAMLARAEEFARRDGASFLLNNEYDILHALSTAILSCDGIKIIDKDHHKVLVQWVATQYTARIAASHANLFEELRKVRNDINYYGQKERAVLEDFYQRNKMAIAALQEMLFAIVREKLKED